MLINDVSIAASWFKKSERLPTLSSLPAGTGRNTAPHFIK